MTRFHVVLIGAAALSLAGPALAQEGSCAVTEIAPGVKMRAANCPTLIGRPAAIQQNRVDNALQQPPAGLYRYSDVEMRVTGPRPAGAAPLGMPGAGTAGSGRRP